MELVIQFDAVNEPEHTKMYNFACLPDEDSDELAHLLSLISLYCPYEESLGPWLPRGCLVMADLSFLWANIPSCTFYCVSVQIKYGLCHKKTLLWGFRQSETQTNLVS